MSVAKKSQLSLKVAEEEGRGKVKITLVQQV